MKKQILFAIVTLSALLQSQAALYSAGDVSGNSGTALNLAIPDANPSGISSSINVSGSGSSLSALTVTLNISDGYNGDLYAYLSCNGTLVTLLNRVGTGSGNPIQSAFGYSTAGFNNVTLDNAATGGSIHNVQNPGSLPTVSFTPDGGSLASFNGVDPNGMWTLFFADLSSGNTSTLNGWSLDITAVPEPVNVALVIFGVGFIGVGVAHSNRGSRKATLLERV